MYYSQSILFYLSSLKLLKIKPKAMFHWTRPENRFAPFACNSGNAPEEKKNV
jgi:hypothetical protein